MNLSLISDKQKRYDTFHMLVAINAASLSFAKRRQVGAAFVSGGSVLAYGFNGMPAGMPNACEDENGNTLPEVIHAEVNATRKLAALPYLEGMWMDLFVTKEPCIECARHLSWHQAEYGWHLNRMLYIEKSASNPGAFLGELDCREVLQLPPLTRGR
jgi:dCMP deaminase